MSYTTNVVRLPGPLVLVIDDDRFSRQVFQAVLEAAGYRVVVAPDGASGLATFRTEHPLVVVTDLAMPVLDGRQVALALQGEPTAPPVIAATAHREAYGEQSDLSELFYAVLDKPVDPTRFLQTVRTALEAA